MSATINALTAIRDEHGDLYAELVADVATTPDHPLHAQIYDCPPEVASRRYYVGRAAQLLRVTFRPDPTKPIELRAFQVIKGEDSPRSSYVPTAEVLADPYTRKLVLGRMKREAKQFADRYRHMAEYAAVVASMLGEDAS